MTSHNVRLSSRCLVDKLPTHWTLHRPPLQRRLQVNTDYQLKTLSRSVSDTSNTVLWGGSGSLRIHSGIRSSAAVKPARRLNSRSSTSVSLPSTSVISDLLNARYGWQVGPDIAQALGKETLSLEREFNRRAGFTAADDRIPEWMRREPLPPHNSVFDVPDSDLDGIFNW